MKYSYIRRQFARPVSANCNWLFAKNLNLRSSVQLICKHAISCLLGSYSLTTILYADEISDFEKSDIKLLNASVVTLQQQLPLKYFHLLTSKTLDFY